MRDIAVGLHPLRALRKHLMAGLMPRRFVATLAATLLTCFASSCGGESDSDKALEEARQACDLSETGPLTGTGVNAQGGPALTAALNRVAHHAAQAARLDPTWRELADAVDAAKNDSIKIDNGAVAVAEYLIRQILKMRVECDKVPRR
jgi:hypothetical protein